MPGGKRKQSLEERLRAVRETDPEANEAPRPDPHADAGVETPVGTDADTIVETRVAPEFEAAFNARFEALLQQTAESEAVDADAADPPAEPPADRPPRRWSRPFSSTFPPEPVLAGRDVVAEPEASPHPTTAATRRWPSRTTICATSAQAVSATGRRAPAADRP